MIASTRTRARDARATKLEIKQLNGHDIVDNVCRDVLRSSTQQLVKQINANNDEVRYIDLGLPSGTLWADRNLCANDIYDFGYYSALDSQTLEENFESRLYNYEFIYTNNSMMRVLKSLRLGPITHVGSKTREGLTNLIDERAWYLTSHNMSLLLNNRDNTDSIYCQNIALSCDAVNAIIDYQKLILQKTKFQLFDFIYDNWKHVNDAPFEILSNVDIVCKNVVSWNDETSQNTIVELAKFAINLGFFITGFEMNAQPVFKTSAFSSYYHNAVMHGKRQLTHEDDIVYKATNGVAHLPSAQNYQELVDNCTKHVVKIIDKNGNDAIAFRFVGPNGNAIVFTTEYYDFELKDDGTFEYFDLGNDMLTSDVRTCEKNQAGNEQGYSRDFAYMHRFFKLNESDTDYVTSALMYDNCFTTSLQFEFFDGLTSFSFYANKYDDDESMEFVKQFISYHGARYLVRGVINDDAYPRDEHETFDLETFDDKPIDVPNYEQIMDLACQRYDENHVNAGAINGYDSTSNMGFAYSIDDASIEFLTNNVTKIANNANETLTYNHINSKCVAIKTGIAVTRNGTTSFTTSPLSSDMFAGDTRIAHKIHVVDAHGFVFEILPTSPTQTHYIQAPCKIWLETTNTTVPNVSHTLTINV